MVGILILIIAIINFVNLSTARASIRQKEIGTRRVVGAGRINLILQFLFESIFINLIAICFAIVLMELFLPHFNKLVGTELNLAIFQKPVAIIIILGGVLLIGTISGLYPAFYLTSFKPVLILKGINSKETKSSGFRKGLIVFQFTASIALIISTIIITQQIRFMKNKDLGFDKNQILWFKLNTDMVNKIEVFYDKLTQYPDIKGISFSGSVPGESMGGWVCVVEGKSISASTLAVDPDYIDLMGLKIIKGRNFIWDSEEDKKDGLIFNETAIKSLGLGNPIGVTVPGLGTIIGVVNDFHY